MTGRRSWSTRTKAFMAIALAFLLWAPQGISTETAPVVTGHSTFYNGDTYDRCLASIAGLLRSRVMWFNDMVLAERYGGKGTFVYITEKGEKNPTTADALYSEGVFFDFVDPNGAHWHVEEVYYDEGRTTPGASNAGDVLYYAGDVVSGRDDHVDRFYVWIVEISERPIMDQFAPPRGEQYHHDLYNFLVLVDTCKFKNATAENYFDVNHTDGLGPDNGHETGASAHRHDGYQADLWIGTRPNIVPAGTIDENALKWQSQWAASGQAARDGESAGSHTVNQTAP